MEPPSLTVNGSVEKVNAMTTAQELHNRIMLEADHAEELRCQKESEDIVQRNVIKPLTKTAQYRKQLQRLRSNSVEVESELKLKEQVEVETAWHLKASMELREANITATENRHGIRRRLDCSVYLQKLFAPRCLQIGRGMLMHA